MIVLLHAYQKGFSAMQVAIIFRWEPVGRLSSIFDNAALFAAQQIHALAAVICCTVIGFVLARQ
jgi:hypothetical protein